MFRNPYGLSDFRLLDSLDSIRFGKNMDFSNIRLLHAKAEIIHCLMFGDGAVIPENQLIDSWGFINIYTQLMKLGYQYKVPIPIKAALRDPSAGIFKTAASLFGKIDEKDTNSRFKLTSYPKLDESVTRRKKWAEYISQGNRPPQEFVLDEEKQILWGLMDILKYLSSSVIAEFAVAKSEDMPYIFAGKISQISNLHKNKQQFEQMFVEHPDPRYPQVIHPEWLKTNQIGPAQEIVNAINEFENKFGRGKIFRRSIFHNDNELVKNANLRKGVLEIADTLYNFNLGISTHADIMSDTTIRNLENPYVLAARGLSNWAKETSEIPIGISITDPIGWISTTGFNWAENINDENFQMALNEIPLEACISLFTEPEWKNSLAKYKYELANLREINRIVISIDELPEEWQRMRDDAKSRLEASWQEHIRICADKIASSSWKLSSGGQIDYSVSDDDGKKEMISFSTTPPFVKMDLELRTLVKAIFTPFQRRDFKNRIQGIVSALAKAFEPPV